MNFQSILVYALAFQLIFANQVPYFAKKAQAQQDTSAPLYSEQELKAGESVFRGLYENLLGSSAANPLDYFSLLRQDFFTNNAKAISIHPESVLFQVIEGLDFSKTFRASDSLHESFNALLQRPGDGFRLAIEGKVVHQFRIPIEALAIAGNYIVFIERDSFNKEANIRHISFIDLNYFNLGKTELPIFRVPIDGQASLESVEIKGNNLYINGKVYEQGLFDFATNMQRILFNVAVNATDAKHLTRLMNYVEPYLEYFKVNLEHAKSSSNSNQTDNLQTAFTEQMRQLEAMQKSGEALEKGALDTLGENFWKPLEASFQSLNSSLQSQRGLVGRTGLLWQRLSIPRPAEVSSLKDKLVHLAVGVYKRSIKKADLYEVAYELGSNKKVKYSTSILAAAAFAYYMPETSLQALLSTVDIIQVLGEMAFGKAQAFANLGWETTKATFTGLNPLKLYETYVADGAWQRTSVGVSAMFTILTLVVGIPHLIVNSYYLVKDLTQSPTIKWNMPDGLPKLYTFLYTYKYASIIDLFSDAKSYIRAVIPQIVPNFIHRQKDLQLAYLEALSDDKKKAPSYVASENTNEELDKMAREFLEKIKFEEASQITLLRRLTNSSMWNSLSGLVNYKLPMLSPAYHYAASYGQKFANIENFAGAMSHFLFSFAAFTKSGVFYTTTWNYFFLLRALVFKPKLALTFVFFPNYFRRSVATDLGKITPPSFWNGGTRFIWQEVAHKFDRINDRAYFEQVREFEREVVEVEKKANAIALREAYKALQKFMGYKSESVIKLSEQKEKLTTDALSSLSYDAKTLFTVYFDKLIEVAMSQYLRQMAESNGVDLESSSRQEIKKWFIHEKINPNSTAIDIEAIVREIASDPILYEQAKEVVNRSNHFIEKQVSYHQHKNYWNLDPVHSGQFSRFVNAEIQMKKASAMARAIRANIVSTLVDKPMELALLFVLSAGINDGPNKPLWDSMFSQDSAFYLSRNIFMGYLAGLIINIFADVWVKVQRDIRVDTLGGFDKIPPAEMANKPFRSWYKHIFFTDKDNRWWDHHKNDSKLIYHNMGPAFVLMAATGMATLGRLDIDFYTLGYVTAFFLPFTGLSSKIEQTFDIASGWVLRHVPKSLHTHPLIIQWANRETTKLRIGFQFYYKLYENVLGQFIMNLMALTTTMNGTRALSRMLFGGKTLTERIIETTTNMAHVVPGAKYVDAACRALFSNNYNSGPLPPKPD
jgi:hypothetical protein